MDRLAGLLSLLLFTFAGAAAVAAPSVSLRAPGALQSAMVQAERALARRETQLAESHYREALFEGWLILGALARQQGDLKASRAAFERATGTVVVTRRARLPLAAVLAQLDETDEAELVLRTLISENPRDVDARRLLARTLADAGRLDAAVQELEQLRNLTPADSENAYLLATAYLQQGRLAAADELLNDIAAALPTPQTWILIGRTYRDADLFDAARSAFSKALEIDPDVPRAHYYLGSVHLLDQGVLALDAAIGEFERELRLSPEDEITNLYLGMARVEERRYEEAIPPLEIASRRPDVSVDALRFLGRALLETGRADEAVAVLRRGLAAAGAAGAEVDPETLGEFRARQLSSLHYQLAQALRRTGDRETSGYHFDQAKRFQAESAESARESLDRYLSSETDAARTLEMGPASAIGEAARTDLEALAALEGSVAESVARAYFNLGVLRVRASEPDRAAGLFDQAAELYPEMPDLQYSLGIARFNAGLFGAATKPLTRALATRPGDRRLQQMLALAWLNQGRYEEAAASFESIAGRAEDPALEYAYGLALVRSGRGAEAEDIFLDLLRQNADWPELNVVLGQAFAQQGNFEAAIETVRRALVLDPEVAEAHATLGEIHLRRGELEQAERELRAELATHPDDDRSRYTLATVLDLAQKADEAAALLRSLLERQPDLAKGRYLLGKIMLTQGAVEAARDQLEAAAGLAPEDANVRYQLGRVYQRLGRGDDAQAQFEAYRLLKRDADAGAGE